MQNSDINIRISTINALTEIGNSDAAKAMVPALSDADAQVRQSAIDAFAAIGYENAHIALSNALKNENILCRQNAVAAFVKIGCEYAAVTLISHLDDEDENVRQSIRDALAGFDREYTVKALSDAANNKRGDYDYYSVRLASIEVLGQIGGKEAVTALIDAFDDEDQYIEKDAAAAFAQIKYDDAVDALTASLHDENFKIRRFAAEAFGEIGDARAAQELIALMRDKETIVQVSAINALGAIGDNSAVEPLIAVLQNEEQNVRISAINALGEIHDERAVESLIAIYNYYDNHDAVTSALAKIGGKKAADTLTPEMNELLAVLKGTEIGDKYEAAKSLALFGQFAAAPVTEILDSQKGDARFYAACALAGMDTDQAAYRLDAAYDDLDLQVIAGAADYFIREGREGSESVLISALNEYGNTRTANVFLNCGNELLEDAACKWADDNGFTITFIGGSGDITNWGSE